MRKGTAGGDNPLHLPDKNAAKVPGHRAMSRVRNIAMRRRARKEMFLAANRAPSFAIRRRVRKGTSQAMRRRKIAAIS